MFELIGGLLVHLLGDPRSFTGSEIGCDSVRFSMASLGTSAGFMTCDRCFKSQDRSLGRRGLSKLEIILVDSDCKLVLA
jgi:hypothetical protein